MVRISILYLLAISVMFSSCESGGSSTAAVTPDPKPVDKPAAKPVDTKWVKNIYGHYEGLLSSDSTDYPFTLTIAKDGKGKIIGTYTIDDAELGDKPYGGKLTNFKAIGPNKCQFNYADNANAGTNADTGIDVFTFDAKFKQVDGESWHGDDTSFASSFSMDLKRK